MTRTAPGPLIEVLLLHRHMAHEDVVAGLAAALRVGALTADAVALEARKFADEQATTGPGSAPAPRGSTTVGDQVASLTERRLRASQLPPDTRPLPSVEQYDQLLPSRRRTTTSS